MRTSRLRRKSRRSTIDLVKDLDRRHNQRQLLKRKDHFTFGRLRLQEKRLSTSKGMASKVPSELHLHTSGQ